jgi:hypothetical protein
MKKSVPRLEARFFRLESGKEPVREWLKSLSNAEMKTVGIEVMYVQFKWPLGKPKVDHIDGPIWK